MDKPKLSAIKTSTEFQSWYWLKTELVALCKQLNLSYTGSKFELRDRILYALEHDGAVPASVKRDKPQSSFNWAKAPLDLETVITDNITFGPNFRRFMKLQIGSKFSCHSDFMDWVKANPGKRLSDAVIKWEELENRKKDPTFKRKIAAHNMLAQYVRDFLADNPGSTFKEALQCWKRKKQLPADNGFVQYDKSDLTST